MVYLERLIHSHKFCSVFKLFSAEIPILNHAKLSRVTLPFCSFLSKGVHCYPTDHISLENNRKLRIRACHDNLCIWLYVYAKGFHERWGYFPEKQSQCHCFVEKLSASLRRETAQKKILIDETGKLIEQFFFNDKRLRKSNQ